MGLRRSSLENLGMSLPDPDFWRGRRVLVTGHTGFKGAWLTLMLSHLGAKVTGLALEPPAGPALYPLIAGRVTLENRVADLRDASTVAAITRAAAPSVVLHLAARTLVPQSFDDPLGTFAVNLTGTQNLLEALRDLPGVTAVVVVTTDKVYRNRNDGHRFREDDPLGGNDPYSASKAAVELAVSCWRESFSAGMPPIATARAGNVIGGGDFAPSRLVPDIVRAIGGEAPLTLRYPHATRPWQHVLDVLTGYLLLAEHLASGNRKPIPSVNFAPDSKDEVPVIALIETFAQAFETPLLWRQADATPPEAVRLALDPRLAMESLGWRPRFRHADMIGHAASWYAAWRRGDDMAAHCARDVATALS